MSAVTVRELTKRYGTRAAVDGLDLDVPTGSLAGFIGPNGAGKTTTLRMLVGLVAPTSGSGEVFGQSISEPERYLGRVGALIEGPAFYPGLSGQQNLRVFAAAAGLNHPDTPGLLARVGLDGRGGDTYKTYSHGMKQRLGIAAALLGDPELLILDEPANGLDPEGIHDMRELLRTLRDEGRTVIVSSHLLAELEQVCNWLIVINHGRRVFQGPPAELLGAEHLTLRPEHASDLDALSRVVSDHGLEPAIEDGSVVATFVAAERHSAEIADVARGAASAGITLIEILAHRPQLEDRYLQLIGNSE